MTFEDARRLFEWLWDATEDQVQKFIAKMTAAGLLRLDAGFELWAHESQLPPFGEGWRVCLMMAGRGFGKTRAGAEWIHRLASGKRGLRIALVGASIRDARSTMVEGVSGLLAVAKLNRSRLVWEPSLGRLKWPNGSEAQLFSGDHADGLRGPEHDLAWCRPDARVAGLSGNRGGAARGAAGDASDRHLLHRGR
ncbi:MAG TPA: terminase family protein [Sphingomicrobium sp.]|nr:terminase family protein [Sphingomicrobium sp.]